MGMRQNIKLVYPDRNVGHIFIYSHWDGGETYKDSGLADKLKKALARRIRWDDDSYLARIIFSEVIKDDIDGETGYGLSPYEIDPEYPTIEVNLGAQTVDGISYEKFITLYE